MQQTSPTVRGPGTRGAAATVAAVSAVAAAALSAIRYWDVGATAVVAAQALVPLAVAPALTAVVAAAMSGRRSPRIAAAAVLTAAGVLGAQAYWAVPSYVGIRDTNGTSLTVLSVNAQYGNADAGQVLAAITEGGVDVVSIVELTPAAVRGLREAGIEELLPHQLLSDRDGAGGSGLYSRFPLTPVSTPELGIFAMPVASIDLPGGEAVTVRAVHPAAPQMAAGKPWRRELAGLQAWAAAAASPLVLVGDFNSGLHHPAYRELLSGAGLQDVHELGGYGLPRTWPLEMPVPAFTHLDHVLVRGFDVDTVRTLTVDGTDHALVLARLHPATWR